MEDFEGATKYAEYKYFAVANEQNKYKLSAEKYSGTAGDYDAHCSLCFLIVTVACFSALSEVVWNRLWSIKVQMKH